MEEFRKEREALEEERRDYVEQLVAFSHKVGELDTKLMLLSAGNGKREEKG